MCSLDVTFNTENTRAGQNPVGNTFTNKIQVQDHELFPTDSAELLQLGDRNANPESKPLF